MAEAARPSRTARHPVRCRAAGSSSSARQTASRSASACGARWVPHALPCRGRLVLSPRRPRGRYGRSGRVSGGSVSTAERPALASARPMAASQVSVGRRPWALGRSALAAAWRRGGSGGRRSWRCGVDSWRLFHERADVRGRIVVGSKDPQVGFGCHGERGGDPAGGIPQQPRRGSALSAPILVLPAGGQGQVIDDLGKERLDRVQQRVEDAAELCRRVGGVQRFPVRAQVRDKERRACQWVPGVEGFRVALGPSVQVVCGGRPGLVGADLLGGAADVVVQLEIGMLQEELRSRWGLAARYWRGRVSAGKGEGLEESED